jgi:hypothetical protein
MELRENLELSTWRQPAGTLSRSVRTALVLAAIATVVLPFAGTRVLWLQGAEATGIPEWLFNNGLAAIALSVVVAIAWPPFQLSRFLRLAVLLPIAHLVVIAIAWPAWLVISPKIDTVQRWYFLARSIPLSAVVVGELVGVAAAAWLIARRRRDSAWSHAFVMVSLVDLLLLGLWLPIVSWFTCHGTWRVENDPSFAMEHIARLTVIVLVPPLVAAIGYAALAIGWPERARKLRIHGVGALITLFGAAVVLRCDAPPAARVVYANYIHVLIGSQIVATAGPLLLGSCVWLRGRAIRRRLASDAGAVSAVVISSDDEPVIACFEIASWLRPPRPLVRSFVAATAAGEVPIAGARLIAPLDPSTTVLSVGESFGALRTGDRIWISSTPEPQQHGDPFRAASSIVGADPVIAPIGVPELTFSDLSLSLWRPAVAYLVILVAVATPALAALLAPYG